LFFSLLKRALLLRVQGHAALAARTAVLVDGEEYTGTALGALHAGALDLGFFFFALDRVVVQNRHLDGLVLVLALLGAGEVLLLLLLALATDQSVVGRHRRGEGLLKESLDRVFH